MKVPIFFRKQRIEELIESCNKGHDLYVKRDFGFEQYFRRLLDDARAYFKLIAQHQKESEICKYTAYYETALKGINPQTLEKVSKGRRENSWIGAYYALSGLNDLFRSSYTELEEKIEAADEMIGQIILSAIQAKALSNEDLQAIGSLDEVEQVWKKLTVHANFKIADQKLRLSIHPKDIFIIAKEVIEKIK